MDEGQSDRIEVIGVSDEKDLVSDGAPIAVTYFERLFRARGNEPIGEQVGTAVGSCRETPGGRSVCTVELDLNGKEGFRKGRVVAVGSLPFEGGPQTGTLTIVGGAGANPAHGGTLSVEIWNPKKYSQTEP
jgi:hypothetical protein